MEANAASTSSRATFNPFSRAIYNPLNRCDASGQGRPPNGATKGSHRTRPGILGPATARRKLPVNFSEATKKRFHRKPSWRRGLTGGALECC
mmetsp:Transcript_6735/g.16512  ORF Transcript_6735/g.16512 Transcript_6735/m.16512 type:complete len:92 (+) Transcript_6735:2138-2413(+)